MSAGNTYLDHAATTPVDPRVAAFMSQVLAESLGNPGSNHSAGRRASALIAEARERVALLLGVAARDVVFTSGATESNNLAIFGSVAAQQRALAAKGAVADGTAAKSGAKGGAAKLGHVVTLATEHKAVLGPVRRLQRDGVRCSFLVPDEQGILTPDALAAALADDTLLVTLLHVNNETGVEQDIASLSAVCRERGVPLHVDAAQSAGKLPLDIAAIDYLSCTAHKLGGPQGIGALYIAPTRRMQIEPQMLGGGQERGLRAGTLATHQVAGFGLACEIAFADREAFRARATQLRDRLLHGLTSLPGVLLNGHPERRSPAILNLSFEGVEGESLYTGLAELAVSTGSACNSSSGEPSYVLRALGRDTQLAQSSLRFSLGRSTTAADIDVAIAAVRRELQRLRGLSPQSPASVADWQAAGGHVVIGEAGARRLGTQLRYALSVDGEVVKAARVQVYGCPHTVAAAHWVAGHLPGRNRGGLAPGTAEKWRLEVGAPVEKLGRMLIIEDALRAAQDGW
ncbi:MAG TPA: cysteine desulfurase family protein [Steroidobacteraceae bacterium]|nr:cysteine desulfurase family protein [Steroidobacteraceae bacterium]